MLPYNTDILFSIFSHYNGVIWPVLLAVHGLLCFLFITLLYRRRGTLWLNAGINVLHIVLWLWVGIGFYYVQFSDFNFMAPVYAGFFVAQALLLTAVMATRWRLSYGFDGGVGAWWGAGLVTAGVVLVPVMDFLAGADWQSLRWFASGPEATLLVATGWLLLTSPKAPWPLWIIPSVVTVKVGVLAYFLSHPPDYIVTLLAASGLVLLFFKRRAV